MMTEDVRGVLRSMETFLNPQLFAQESTIQHISRSLREGRLVVIKRAFKEAFAQRMFACLDQFEEWKLYEGADEHFQYRHHNIYEERLFPPALRWCDKVFRSDSTIDLIQRLSGRDCSGKILFSASWYRPGDYSLPHNDHCATEDDGYRQVAFVWHLTKDWRPEWGGALYWCPSNRYLPATFNTLLLFNVTKSSMHFVTPVSPSAQSKRLAINGWWTGREATGDLAPCQETVAQNESLIEIF
jgi:Rps23 Pro-64 3,4-dihydroxylase Tpa1-like proline 4-hydroxylase